MKGPSPFRTSTSSAASRAATSVENEPASMATSTISGDCWGDGAVRTTPVRVIPAIRDLIMILLLLSGRVSELHIQVRVQAV